MPDHCKECGNELVQLTPQSIGELIRKFKPVYGWEDVCVGEKFNIPGLGLVELVYNSYLSVADDNGPVKMVWSTRLGDVGLEGYYSSYSGSQWGTEFAKAERKVKEVVYFE